MSPELWRDRLGCFLPEYVEACQTKLVVRELEAAGEAEIQCSFSGDAILVRPHRKPLSSLKNQKCADALIWLKGADGKWELHIIECKRSVGPKEWTEIKLQYAGGCWNALAIGGVLGLGEPTQIICHVAFREDKLSRSPVLMKMPLAQSHTPTGQDWLQDSIQISDGIRARSSRIQLDKDTGRGSLEMGGNLQPHMMEGTKHNQ